MQHEAACLRCFQELDADFKDSNSVPKRNERYEDWKAMLPDSDDMESDSDEDRHKYRNLTKRSAWSNRSERGLHTLWG